MSRRGPPARLDTFRPPPDTTAAGEGAPVAESVSSSAAEAAGARLVERARAAAGRLVAAKSVAHQAQVREALTRTELTMALHEALTGRAESERRFRSQAFETYLARQGGGRRLRRRGAASRFLDRLLTRLASPGRALVIARSGVWRGTGRRLFDLRHMAAYARRRANGSVAPPAPFDQVWYLETYPEVASAGASPLVDYLVGGAELGRRPHPLFDADWYRRENFAELTATGLTPLEHFVRRGAALGRNPHPLFDIAHYVAQSPNLDPGEDPLSHYVREGWSLGLSPHPLFDPDWYLDRAPREARQVPPLTHYLASGWRTGLSPHPLFDPAWYLQTYPDVALAELEPLTHFLLSGAADGRSPGPWFDLPHYVALRGEALPPKANPLIDYLQGGAWAVAEARPGFPTAAYLAATPELAREGLTPLEHWARRHAR